MNQPIVILNTVQHAEALAVGHDRANAAAGWGHRNNLVLDEDASREQRIHGACAERAVHTLFPCLEWHKEDIADRPDIGDFIDVKAPRQLPARPYRHLLGYINRPNEEPDTKPHWAYVLALSVGIAGRGDRFKIMGWAWGEELIAAPTREFQAGRPAHYLEPSIPPLRPIRDLQKFVGIEPPPIADDPEGFAKWLADNSEPSVSKLVERFGAFNRVPIEAWIDFDARLRRWREAYRTR